MPETASHQLVNLSDMRVEIKKIIRGYQGEEGILIKIIQDIQSMFDHVPEKAVDILCNEMDLDPVRIYGILTFYGQFRLSPPGKHTMTVCQGTACHVMGSKKISEYVERKLSTSPGSTTSDGLFTLEKVACMGCCGIAPVVVVDHEIRGHQSIGEVDHLMKEIRERERD
ncbi:MAG: NAD(P)H-dependent oxidoreductase subunit E [Candidatus Thermoplasmatota archaeon]|jgi:NADH-quinone oxidoreductase subunit E|nr:NAD(P)H-dependent oxidoreductase subunit E [Candidatus Thermoplasmatota archaeon]